MTGSAMWTSNGSSGWVRRLRRTLRQMRVTTVVSHAARFSISSGAARLQPQPGLLHGVVGLGDRAEHPVADGPQADAVLFELLGKGFFVHPVTNLRAVVSNS